MAGIKFPQRKLSLLLLHLGREALNRKGSAMLLAMVLTMAILPAAGTLAYITRSDLASALDDYHRIKASYAAQGALALVEADLLNGGDGQISWPDSGSNLHIFVQEENNVWDITITARCDRAVVEIKEEIQKREEEKPDPAAVISPTQVS